MNMTDVAQIGLIVLLSASLVFHFGVILKIVPYKIVCGGRLKSDTEMYRFEIVSVLINCLFLFVILVQSGMLFVVVPQKIMTVVLWIMAALFLFNTFGNVVSKNRMERLLFTPLTIILTIFSLILALTN
jgi:hypothetical protein